MTTHKVLIGPDIMRGVLEGTDDSRFLLRCLSSRKERPHLISMRTLMCNMHHDDTKGREED